MKFVYFVSDAHLGADSDSIEKVKEKNLLSFLALVKETGKSLYIVGDLFDFWFEYRHAIPSQHHRILAKFSQLVEQGIEVDYVAGNHDYWFRDFLSGQVGIRVHQKPVETHLGNSKFFISHGDGIIKNDPGYRILKKILQNPVSICLYQMLHPDWGIPLARFASNRSRKHPTPQHDSDYLEFAKSKLDQGFDFVILGHSHRPLIYQYQNGKAFINIGDWIENFTYGKYDGKNLTLQRWKNYQSQKDFCAHKITGNFCAV